MYIPYQDPVNVIQISYFHPIMFNNCEDTILLQLDLAELMMQTAKEQFLYFQYIPNEEVTTVGKHCGLRCNVYLIALVYMNLFETNGYIECDFGIMCLSLKSNRKRHIDFFLLWV